MFRRMWSRPESIPIDHWGQVIVWLGTSAIFPIVVFVGFGLAGAELGDTIGNGELLLVAGALTAPIVGAVATLPGARTLGRSLTATASVTGTATPPPTQTYPPVDTSPAIIIAVVFPLVREMDTAGCEQGIVGVARPSLDCRYLLNLMSTRSSN